MEKELKPLIGKAVAFDPKAKTCKIPILSGGFLQERSRSKVHEQKRSSRNPDFVTVPTALRQIYGQIDGVS